MHLWLPCLVLFSRTFCLGRFYLEQKKVSKIRKKGGSWDHDGRSRESRLIAYCRNKLWRARSTFTSQNKAAWGSLSSYCVSRKQLPIALNTEIGSVRKWFQQFTVLEKLTCTPITHNCLGIKKRQLYLPVSVSAPSSSSAGLTWHSKVIRVWNDCAVWDQLQGWVNTGRQQSIF